MRLSREERVKLYEQVRDMGVGEIIPIHSKDDSTEIFGFYRKDETPQRYIACMVCSTDPRSIGKIAPEFREAGFFRRVKNTARFARATIPHILCVASKVDRDVRE